MANRCFTMKSENKGLGKGLNIQPGGRCRLTIVIDAALWHQFVQTAAKGFGYHKRVIRQALEAAMQEWLEEQEIGNCMNKKPKGTNLVDKLLSSPKS